MVDYLLYIASNYDLIPAFRTDVFKAEQHYLAYGRAEGRSLTGFDALGYGASNPDLARAFGTNFDALTRHWINTGWDEKRSSTTFNADAYAASNPDVFRAFGRDVRALETHYLTYGAKEGRTSTAFDPVAYLAANRDIGAVIGTNPATLTAHYLQSGLAEGRSTGSFDPLKYLLSYKDFVAAGLSATQARQHFLDYGWREGRSVNLDEDQPSHVAITRGFTAGSLSGANDVDWYTITIDGSGFYIAGIDTAAQLVAINLLKPDGPVGSSLTGAQLTLYNTAGRPIASKTIGTDDSFDGWLAFSVALYRNADRVYHVAVTNAGPADYSLAVVTGEAWGQRGPFTPPPIPVVTGTDGPDLFLYQADSRTGVPTILGSPGNDIYGGSARDELFLGGAGADLLDGRTGNDTVDYGASQAGVSVDLANGTISRGGDAEGDRLFNIERLTGSAFADVLVGTAAAETLTGGGGDDRLTGGDGNDVLIGGDGADTVLGGVGDDYVVVGPGNDILDGGLGLDTLAFLGSTVGVRADLRAGTIVHPDLVGDTVTGFEAVDGGDGADLIANAPGATSAIAGGNGNDTLIDRNTAVARVVLSGGNGDDLLIGSYLLGGSGADTMVVFREDGPSYAFGQDDQTIDTVVLDTFAHQRGTPFKVDLYVGNFFSFGSFGDRERLDLSDFRDEDGAILDFADIQRHFTAPGTLDMTGFRTAAGDPVTGAVRFITQFDSTPAIPITQLSAANFVFSGGVDWQATLPSGFPVV